MADIGVRTGSDELVVDLDNDAAAPVAAQNIACPSGERKAEDGEDESG